MAWPRELAREAGIARRESLHTKEEAEAERRKRARLIEVYASLGDEKKEAEVKRKLTPLPFADLVARFLEALEAGECPPKPGKRTLDEVYRPYLQGKTGLTKAAERAERSQSTGLDKALVERWLDAERLAGRAQDTLRLKLVCTRRLARWAAEQGHLAEKAADLIGQLKTPKGVKGRAKADGVPTWGEVEAVLQAMTPTYWRTVAECQLRLGLRKGEVLALNADWIDEHRGVIRVVIDDTFTSKDREERVIDADPVTVALAKEVVALKGEHAVTESGYRMVWRRALAKAEEAGVSWPYRAKTHALRQVFATTAVARGIPVKAVADALGHSTVKVTENHYLGRIRAEGGHAPFADVPRIGAKVG